MPTRRKVKLAGIRNAWRGEADGSKSHKVDWVVIPVWFDVETPYHGTSPADHWLAGGLVTSDDVVSIDTGDAKRRVHGHNVPSAGCNWSVTTQTLENGSYKVQLEMLSFFNLLKDGESFACVADKGPRSLV